MIVCTKCGKTVNDGCYCDQCGKKLSEMAIARPELVSPAIYKCKKCNANLPVSDTATCCSSCGAPFRLMPQCPEGHIVRDFAARFCPECGVCISTDKAPQLKLAPVVQVERFAVAPRRSPSSMPQCSVPAPTVAFTQTRSVHQGIWSRLMNGVRRLLNPTPRIVSPPQYPQVPFGVAPFGMRSPSYPQGVPSMGQGMPWGVPQQGVPSQFMPPQFMPQQFVAQQAQFTGMPNTNRFIVYPRGFHQPQRIVHPQGQPNNQGWPNGWWQR